MIKTPNSKLQTHSGSGNSLVHYCENSSKENHMDKTKLINTLNMIAEDMAEDAAKFDGKPFTGRTVAEYFGNQGAAITALAGIIKTILEQEA
jgi:hypothetical protein